MIAAKTRYTCKQNCAGIQNNDQNSIRAALGLGAQYDVFPQVALRAEYEHFNSLKSEALFVGSSGEAFESSYDLLSLGVLFKF